MLAETMTIAMEEITPTRATTVGETLTVGIPAEETRLVEGTRARLVDPGQPEAILLEAIGLANERPAGAMLLVTELAMTQQS